MDYLVTGASGFVGRNLFNAFENHKCINLVAWDRSKDFCHQIIAKEGIIHLAGKAHDIKELSDPKDYYLVNTELTKTCFDAFLKSSASVFIYFSSVKASADEVSGILLESDAPSPKTHYGKSKLMAEEYILSKTIPESKRVYILRPCLIHGPGNKGNLNLLFKWVESGYPWPLGAFDNIRSFCSIENVSFVVNELLTRSDIPSGVYNLADDQPCSTNYIIKLMENALGKKILSFKIPKAYVYLVAKAGDILHLPINSDRLKKLSESYVISNNKLINKLGKNLPLSVDEGLKNTISNLILK
jgi:nucleoside-diphosphate-sugar epimerase